MLREYRLTNFKAFGEAVTIPIRPLTLIFGANSSGKSSIFQSLLLLKQTLEEAKTPETVLLPKGSLVDLGTYRDFIHRHETERDFKFEAHFSLEPSPSEFFQKIYDRLNAKNARFSLRFSYDKGSSTVATERTDIAIGDEEHPMITYFPRRHAEETFTIFDLDSEAKFWREWFEDTKASSREKLEQDQDDVEYVVYNKKTYKKPFDDFLKILEDYPFEDAFKHLKESLLFLTFEYKNFLPHRPKPLETEKDTSRELIADFIDSIVSIDELPDDLKALDWPPTPTGPPLRLSERSPFRALLFSKEAEPLFSKEPERKFEQASPGPLTTLSPVMEVASNFQNCLENMVYLGPLRSQPERYYTFSGDTTDYVGQSGEHLPSLLFTRPELLEQTNNDLERLSVKYQLKLSELQYKDGSPSNLFSLYLIDTKTGIDANLRDVGLGISQVLPVVVQSRLSEQKTLLIEQPEIHLHPAHQAELGDMFIRSALGEGGNTFLLETHSENLILRILRRIRETNDNELPEGFPPIRPEDVAVLYVQPGENGAQVIEIPVTEDGDFARPWPQGFFEESVKELF